ncbi:LANO_0E12068g1_1 [Lachancea nothofagi CBS 11611]|uniref:LANO_0E12068g1_1 n=1 Tax=Lachancea nothofagi CBS 11611 TaxID=1266666 RepID=A0A1G4JXX4_9SACH|nr:LANO_0E12068g1_1 [Lachancea nothofagi CBS 11611]
MIESDKQQSKRKFEGPKREAIINLSKYADSKIRVKLMGGRLVIGTLKGYDQLMNLVLDETTEHLRDPEDDTKILKGETRELGLVVIRGTMLLTLSPLDGSEIISGPSFE